MNSPILCLTEVEWRKVGEMPPPPQDSTWQRNQTCPQKGELRWCQVHLESQEWLNIGQMRWLLYQLENTFYNGMDSPEELDSLAIVESEVLDVDYGSPYPPVQSGFRQWWQVRCLRVIPLAAIPQCFPPLPPMNGDDFRPRGTLDYATEKLELYSWGTQVSETKIYARKSESNSQMHLVFYQRSIDNRCEIYNWPVT